MVNEREEPTDGRRAQVENRNGLGWLNVARSAERALGPVAAVALVTPVFLWAGVKTLFCGRDGVLYYKIKRM